MLPKLGLIFRVLTECQLFFLILLIGDCVIHLFLIELSDQIQLEIAIGIFKRIVAGIIRRIICMHHSMTKLENRLDQREQRVMSGSQMLKF
jgi:hypothetical protein